MPAWMPLTFTPGLYGRALSKLNVETLKCPKCGCCLKVGAEVMRHLKRGKTEYVCKGCYQRMWI